MRKIRWGIAGPGVIAEKFAEAIKNVDCAELTAVASRSEERGKTFAEKHSISNVFCGYEAMAKSDCIDAVYIATPHPFHKGCGELFAKGGKHILCEKPLCINAFQAKTLADCARENGVFLMEAMWTKFLPVTNYARSLVKEGAIGKLKAIEAKFCYSITPPEDPKLFKNDMAGGSLLDVGVYGILFASLFAEGTPEIISSVCREKDGIDLQTELLMKYSDGTIAEISSAIDLAKPDDAVIYGTRGHIRIPKFYGANELFVTADGEERHVSMPFAGNGFEEEIYEACQCILSGKLQSDIHPVKDSVAVLEIMDKVRNQNYIKYPFDGE